MFDKDDMWEAYWEGYKKGYHVETYNTHDYKTARMLFDRWWAANE